MGAYRGALSGVRPDDLAAHVVRAVGRAQRRRPGARSPTSTSAPPTSRARTTATWRGWRRCSPGCPTACPGATVNRLCASGLEAVNAAARAVKLGEGDFYLAGRGRVDEPGALGGRQAGARPAARRADDARHDAGLALRQPADGRAGRLDRVDGRDRRERRRALRDQPRGPGRLRPAQPPARGRRRRGRPVRRGDRPDRGAAGDARRSSSRPTRDRGPTPRWRRWRSCARSSARAAPSPPATPRPSTTAPPACSSPPRPGSRSSAPSRSPGSSPSASPASTPPTWASARPSPCRARSPPPASRLEQIDLIELNEAFASQVARLRPRARHRRGAPQRQRRRDRPRPPARLLRRPPHHHPRPRAAPPRRPLRHRDHVRRRRPGPGDRVRSGLSDKMELCAPIGGRNVHSGGGVAPRIAYWLSGSLARR